MTDGPAPASGAPFPGTPSTSEQPSEQPAEQPAAGREPGLSTRERELLGFERQWWRHPGAKDTAIRERFGTTPTRYYQLLNALVDRPEALAEDPLLVRRLRRLRAARHRQRAGGALGRTADRG
jgi:hypothetical protein